MYTVMLSPTSQMLTFPISIKKGQGKKHIEDQVRKRTKVQFTGMAIIYREQFKSKNELHNFFFKELETNEQGTTKAKGA